MTAPAPRSRAAALGVAWALAYLPIHIYWALSGGVWPMEELPEVLEAAEWKQANWGASVLIVGAALVCLALDRPWADVLPRWMVLGVAYVGAAFAVLHWVVFSAESVSRMVGVIDLPVTNFTRWNLFVFEPWFLGMGVLLAFAARHRARRPRRAPAAEPASGGWGLAGAASVTLVLGGLVVVLFGVMTFSVVTFLAFGPALMLAGLVLQLVIRQGRRA